MAQFTMYVSQSRALYVIVGHSRHHSAVSCLKTEFDSFLSGEH